ncbi:hypothetical protein [Erwinia sp. E_sp_B04_7]|uniref:hypothetical protein n=1 Tax=unclassified Erwinia TaxID=2622719 RepID=UPI0030CE6E4A
MYKNEDEKLIDILLGEAVMVLLKDDAAISNAALIRQLQAMASAESDTVRQRACRRAISEVRSYMAADHESNKHENMTHMFSSEGPPDGTKKH